MLPARIQVVLGLALLIAASTAAAAAPSDLHPEVRAEASADASVDANLPAPHDATDAVGDQEARDAADAPGALDEPTLPDALRDALPEAGEPLAKLSADAQAGLEASSRASAAGSHRTSGTSASDLGHVGALVESLPDPVRETAPPALAAAGVLALFQAFGWWRALGLGGVALYSRLSKSELLDNEHRDRVYKLVQEQPGVSMSEIGGRLGLGWGTVVYHLDRLERAGFLASERAGLHRCFFPVGTVPRQSREHLGALKADTTRGVALFLLERPGASQTDLCESLGLSASAASKQVTKLEKAGLVRREREWKTVHLYPESTLQALLGGHGEVQVAPQQTPVAAGGLASPGTTGAVATAGSSPALC